MNAKRIIIDSTYEGILLKNYLKKQFNIGYTTFQTMIRKKEIKLSNILTKDLLNYKLKQGEELVIYNREIHETNNNNSLIDNSKNSIYLNNLTHFERIIKEISLYENKDFLLINKPSGISSQGGTKLNFSLDNILKHTYSLVNQKPPKLIHRLDKNVNGLMLLGKSQDFISNASDSFKNKHSIEKTYFLISQGIPNFINLLFTKITQSKNNSRSKANYLTCLQSAFNNTIHIYSNEDFTKFIILIDNYIFDPINYQLTPINISQKLTMERLNEEYPVQGELILDSIILYGKSIYDHSNILSILDNKTLYHNSTSHDNYTLLRYKLNTGRKHQIRKHMSIGLHSPILNDSNYFYSNSRSPVFDSILNKLNKNINQNIITDYDNFLIKYNINTPSHLILLSSVKISLSNKILSEKKLSNLFTLKKKNIQYETTEHQIESNEGKEVNELRRSETTDRTELNHVFSLSNLPPIFHEFLNNFKIKY